MRAYRPAKPVPFRVSPAFTQLPLDLLRDSLVTRNPALASAAAADYLRYVSGQAKKPTMLPQRMAFQQWKTAPDMLRRPWWQSAMSWHEMDKGFTHGVPNRVARKIPPPPAYYPIEVAAAARGAGMLYPEGDYVPVVARPVRQNRATATMMGRAMPPEQAYIEQTQAMQLQAHHRRALRTAETIRSARSALVGVHRFVRG